VHVHVPCCGHYSCDWYSQYWSYLVPVSWPTVMTAAVQLATIHNKCLPAYARELSPRCVCKVAYLIHLLITTSCKGTRRIS
jgi:hypothetical protein